MVIPEYLDCVEAEMSTPEYDFDFSEKNTSLSKADDSNDKAIKSEIVNTHNCHCNFCSLNVFFDFMDVQSNPSKTMYDFEDIVANLATMKDSSEEKLFVDCKNFEDDNHDADVDEKSDNEGSLIFSGMEKEAPEVLQKFVENSAYVNNCDAKNKFSSEKGQSVPSLSKFTKTAPFARHPKKNHSTAMEFASFQKDNQSVFVEFALYSRVSDVRNIYIVIMNEMQMDAMMCSITCCVFIWIRNQLVFHERDDHGPTALFSCSVTAVMQVYAFTCVIWKQNVDDQTTCDSLGQKCVITAPTDEPTSMGSNGNATSLNDGVTTQMRGLRLNASSQGSRPLGANGDGDDPYDPHRSWDNNREPASAVGDASDRVGGARPKVSRNGQAGNLNNGYSVPNVADNDLAANVNNGLHEARRNMRANGHGLAIPRMDTTLGRMRRGFDTSHRDLLLCLRLMSRNHWLIADDVDCQNCVVLMSLIHHFAGCHIMICQICAMIFSLLRQNMAVPVRRRFDLTDIVRQMSQDNDPNVVVVLWNKLRTYFAEINDITPGAVMETLEGIAHLIGLESTPTQVIARDRSPRSLPSNLFEAANENVESPHLYDRQPAVPHSRQPQSLPPAGKQVTFSQNFPSYIVPDRTFENTYLNGNKSIPAPQNRGCIHQDQFFFPNAAAQISGTNTPNIPPNQYIPQNSAPYTPNIPRNQSIPRNSATNTPTSPQNQFVPQNSASYTPNIPQNLFIPRDSVSNAANFPPNHRTNQNQMLPNSSPPANPPQPVSVADLSNTRGARNTQQVLISDRLEQPLTSQPQPQPGPINRSSNNHLNNNHQSINDQSTSFNLSINNSSTNDHSINCQSINDRILHEASLETRSIENTGVMYGTFATADRMANEWVQAALRGEIDDRTRGVIFVSAWFLQIQHGNRYNEDEQWERVSELGKGTSGTCHLAVDRHTQKRFCVKQIHYSKFKQREMAVWSRLNHPGVVTFYGPLFRGEYILMLSEVVTGGTLTDAIQLRRPLQRISTRTALMYIHQVLEVLVYLEECQVVSGDIKSDNILLVENTNAIKLTDFGEAFQVADGHVPRNKPSGTQTHYSPEKARCEGHDYRADVWALGCVFYHILTGQHPWVRTYGDRVRTLVYIIGTTEPTLDHLPQSIPHEAREFLRLLWRQDVENRPHARELINHPIFRFLEEQNDNDSVQYSTVSNVESFRSTRRASSMRESGRLDSRRRDVNRDGRSNQGNFVNQQPVAAGNHGATVDVDKRKSGPTDGNIVDNRQSSPNEIQTDHANENIIDEQAANETVNADRNGNATPKKAPRITESTQDQAKMSEESVEERGDVVPTREDPDGRSRRLSQNAISATEEFSTPSNVHRNMCEEFITKPVAQLDMYLPETHPIPNVMYRRGSNINPRKMAAVENSTNGINRENVQAPAANGLNRNNGLKNAASRFQRENKNGKIFEPMASNVFAGKVPQNTTASSNGANVSPNGANRNNFPYNACNGNNLPRIDELLDPSSTSSLDQDETLSKTSVADRIAANSRRNAAEIPTQAGNIPLLPFDQSLQQLPNTPGSDSTLTPSSQTADTPLPSPIPLPSTPPQAGDDEVRRRHPSKQNQTNRQRSSGSIQTSGSINSADMFGEGPSTNATAFVPPNGTGPLNLAGPLNLVGPSNTTNDTSPQPPSPRPRVDTKKKSPAPSTRETQSAAATPFFDDPFESPTVLQSTPAERGAEGGQMGNTTESTPNKSSPNGNTSWWSRTSRTTMSSILDDGFAEFGQEWVERPRSASNGNPEQIIDTDEEEGGAAEPDTNILAKYL